MKGENKGFGWFVLNIEYNLGLPTLVCLDGLEAMEGDGFHVGPSDVATWIEFFSQDNHFQISPTY